MLKILNKFIAIDPGLHGLALTTYINKQLYAAYYWELPKTDLANRIWTACKCFDYTTGIPDVVIEYPIAYNGRSAKGDTNDLIRLGSMIGALVAALPDYSNAWLISAPDWKGNLSKDATREHAKRVLTKKELVVIEQALAKAPLNRSLDMWDAVSLGLCVAGRGASKSHGLTMAHFGGK